VTACKVTALLLAVLLLGGCETLAYYTQSAGGQLALMRQARPVDELLAAPDTDPALAVRLRRSQAMRRFASERLALPDNDSYRSYADIGRRALVWTVVATPRYGVQPRRWCYPLLGCLSYRGYFAEADARAEGQRLRARGLDVAVLPVPAYSTLGWFDDPLPSTVIHWPQAELAGLIFHELAHQRVYIAGDTAFNEAYASTVAEQGVALWLADRPALLVAWRQRQARTRQVSRLLLEARERLAAAFASAADDSERQRRKDALYARVTADYRRLSAAWPSPRPYGYWFADGRLNNAYLAQLATYDRWRPAFEALWRQQQGDAAAFHAAVAALGSLPPAQRQARLAALTAASEDPGSHAVPGSPAR